MSDWSEDAPKASETSKPDFGAQHITDVSVIKAAYDKRIGHEARHGQIYYVLHRHGWSKKLPRSKHPKSATPEAIDASKKLTLEYANLPKFSTIPQEFGSCSRMKQVSAVKPKHCWCRKGVRPRVPCHHIPQYRYAYGAVDPLSGDSYFLILPYCNTLCMNIFLEHLSMQYPDDLIVLVCDGAAWHKSVALKSFPNIELMFIPPYTPEMNPIEQVWKELRTKGFHNEAFLTLEKIVDRLCDTICNLTTSTIRSITAHNWIIGCFS